MNSAVRTAFALLVRCLKASLRPVIADTGEWSKMVSSQRLRDERRERAAALGWTLVTGTFKSSHASFFHSLARSDPPVPLFAFAQQ